MGWWRGRSETLRDGVGAVAIVLVFLIAQQTYGAGGSEARAAVVMAVMGIALTVRRRWPVLTYVAALLIAALASTGLEFLGIAGYTLAAHSRVRPPVVAAGSAVALTVGYLQYWPSLQLDVVAGDLILIAAVSVLPAVFGRGVRSARATTAELQARNAELEVLRERAAAHAVEAERFRIARELHDVVAHHVSAMTVRARAGDHVARRDPRAAADALAYIASAGTSALTAMGTFVGALRGERPGVDRDDLAPQPGLADIPALLEAFRGTGLVVHERLDEGTDGVSPALGLNAYRIVQEALTNTIRHGAAERAWVEVAFDGHELRVEVDDNGRGLGADQRPHGHGLIGIAERAAMHGGTSSLGASPHGGCRLAATLSTAAPGQP